MKLFSQVLAELRGGQVERELTDELRKLVERVQDTGSKGAVTLTVTLTPKGRGNREVHVGAKIAIKTPPSVDLSEPSIFFGVRGDLVRDDPEQADLFNRGPRLAADGRSPAEQQQADGEREAG